MSLSDGSAAKDKHYTGRVILGMDTPGPDEMSIQDMEGKKRPVWDEVTNAEYISRVKKKAQAMAKEILAQAVAEAEQIKVQAHEEGLNLAQQEAQAHYEKEFANMAEAFAQTLAQVQEQGKNIWAAQRQDFVAVVRMAVERTLRVKLEQSKTDVLGSLLDQALDRIDSMRGLTVRVAPQDQESIEALLTAAKANMPSLDRWRIKTDANITPGGLVLESDHGMVDNTVDSRFEEISAIFDQLAATES